MEEARGALRRVKEATLYLGERKCVGINEIMGFLRELPREAFLRGHVERVSDYVMEFLGLRGRGRTGSDDEFQVRAAKVGEFIVAAIARFPCWGRLEVDDEALLRAHEILRRADVWRDPPALPHPGPEGSELHYNVAAVVFGIDGEAGRLWSGPA